MEEGEGGLCFFPGFAESEDNAVGASVVCMGASLPAGFGSPACAQHGMESAPGTARRGLGSLQLWSATHDMDTAVLLQRLLARTLPGGSSSQEDCRPAEGLDPLALQVPFLIPRGDLRTQGHPAPH